MRKSVLSLMNSRSSRIKSRLLTLIKRDQLKFLKTNIENRTHTKRILKSKLRCLTARSLLIIKQDKPLGTNNSNCTPPREMFKIKWLKEKISDRRHSMNMLRREDKSIQLSTK